MSPRRMMTGLGVVWMACAALVNPWTVTAFLARYDAATPRPVWWTVLAIDLLLVLWAAITVTRRGSALVARVNLSLLSLLLVAPLAGEIGLRIGIGLAVPMLRRPELYASFMSDDDHWKLRHRWADPRYDYRFLFSDELAPTEVDETLGWIPKRTPDNPLGLIRDAGETPRSDLRPVLFYGDSFTAGVRQLPMADRIPPLLGTLLPDHTVYNLGVPGYGLDQMLIRFRSTVDLFEQPIVVVGVFTNDLDRAVLRVRDSAKPYFVVDHGQLEMRGVPIPRDIATWHAEHGPEITSYLWALFTTQCIVEPLAGDDYRRSAKEEINRALLGAFVDETRSRGLPLLFALFYARGQMRGEPGWREVLVKQSLAELHVPYYDSKEPLVTTSRTLPNKMRDLYFPDGHPNQRGNRVLASGIAAALAPLLRTSDDPEP